LRARARVLGHADKTRVQECTQLGRTLVVQAMYDRL